MDLQSFLTFFSFFQLVIKSPWIDRQIMMNITTQNVACTDLVVTVKLTWEAPYGIRI